MLQIALKLTENLRVGLIETVEVMFNIDEIEMCPLHRFRSSFSPNLINLESKLVEKYH